MTTSTKIFRRRKCRDCYRKTKDILILRRYQWINTYKQKRGCVRCGINNPVVLDFHHRNERTKEFGVAAFRREVGFKKLQNEIEKCDIMCANCHRIAHHETKREKSDGA